MTNSWMNEDGEPIMDGAAWRFEQQLDMDSNEERARMQWDDDYYAGAPDECPHCGSDDPYDDLDHEDGACLEDDEPDGMEDQWLDGSYEE